MFTRTLDLFERLVVAIEKIANNPAVPVTTVAAPLVEKKAPASKKTTAPAAEKSTTPPAEKAPETSKVPLVETVDDDLLGGNIKAPEVTLDMLLALVPELLKTIEKAKVKAVIETVGNAARISDIKPDKYAATYAALKAL